MLVEYLEPIIEGIEVNRVSRYISLASYVLIVLPLVLLAVTPIIVYYVYVPVGPLVTVFSIGLSLQFFLAFWRYRARYIARAIRDKTRWIRVVDEEITEADYLDAVVEVKAGEVGFSVPAYIEDELPSNFVVVDGDHRALVMIASGDSEVLRYRARAVMGTHIYGPIRIKVLDPLGLFNISLVVPLHNRVRVLPRLFMDPREITLNLTSRLPGGVSLTNRPGIGIEYFSTREYVAGMDYRHIDWRATARLQKLMVKEFEEEATINILLYMLITPLMFRGVRGIRKIEVLSRIVSTLANYLAFRGDVYAFGYTIVASTPVKRFTNYGRGYRHTYFIRRILSDIPFDARFFYRDVTDEFIAELSRCTRRGKTYIILFTDFNDDLLFAEEVIRRLYIFKRYGHEIIIVLPHTVLYEEEAIKTELYRLKLYDIADKALALYRVYSTRKKEIIAGIIDLIRGYGYYPIYESPRDTVFDIIYYIENMRRYYV